MALPWPWCFWFWWMRPCAWGWYVTSKNGPGPQESSWDVTNNLVRSFWPRKFFQSFKVKVWRYENIILVNYKDYSYGYNLVHYTYLIFSSDFSEIILENVKFPLKYFTPISLHNRKKKYLFLLPDLNSACKMINIIIHHLVQFWWQRIFISTF